MDHTLKSRQTRKTFCFVFFFQQALLPCLPLANHLSHLLPLTEQCAGHTEKGHPGKRRHKELTKPCHQRLPSGQLESTTSLEESIQSSRNNTFQNNIIRLRRASPSCSALSLQSNFEHQSSKHIGCFTWLHSSSHKVEDSNYLQSTRRKRLRKTKQREGA